MNSGQKLWREAIKIIPGGNGLLSKRPSRYGADIWPTYFSKAKGCKIWDLDGNEYIDMAQSGVGSAILGYSDDDINEAVIQAIHKGINTTLNAPEEVELAKKLLEVNPTMGGVKFARGGGEAMSIAVRIARAYTNKDIVAFSGYHGWTDWYLAANLSSKSNLDEHLLSGLSPVGLPKGLSGTCIPFKYNDVENFLKVISNNPKIGVIVLEGARYDFPTKDFLKTIDVESKKKGIVVIVDEITSGWRVSESGVYRIFDFNPDIAVYGKALGNGFAISAVVGKKNIMSVAEDSFISSTMWTERVGFVAGLATINKLLKYNVHKQLIEIGDYIGKNWLSLAKKYNLKLSVTDYKPLIGFKLGYGKDNDSIISLFIQEMLSRGYLVSSNVYVTFSHTKEIVDRYLKDVDEVFYILSKAIESSSVLKKLNTEIRSDAFKIESL
ncbi:MAG: aminotransferase class III [Candidatus Cloacimonadota bacterium]|nr:MAG: aminotransferase class III [Candidatus Cloacimonadota bacterium]